MSFQHAASKMLICLAVIGLFQTEVNAQNYPPAQGPPLVTADNAPSYPVYSLKNLVNQSIQKAIDTVNADIARKAGSTHVSAHVSFTSTMYEPSLNSTTKPDAPNETVVGIPFMIQYTVSDIKYYGIPYFSRNIFQDLNIQVSCEGWYTPNGKVSVIAQAQPPFLDGASFGEQALNFFMANTLTNLVNQKLSAALPAGFSQFIATPFKCNYLGLDPGTAPAYNDGAIKYDYKKPRSPVTVASALNQATIQVKSIKRLRARSVSDPNTPLYKPSENIQLSFYADQAHQTASITGIAENETRTLNLPVITLPKPGNNDLLVLIANIVQLPEYNTDTRFYVYDRNARFGNGTQEIIIQKSYWQPPMRLPGGQTTKPIEVKVDAYDLTVDVHVPEQVLAGDNQ